MMLELREKALTYADADHKAVAMPMVSAITPPVAEPVKVTIKSRTKSW